MSMSLQFDLSSYIPRRLFRFDESGNRQTIGDTDLFTRSGPIVVLGEPGMGKSFLLERLSRSHPNATRVRASSFVRRSINWAREHPNSAPVIDGLDEVAALQEGDPLHNVLKALREIDYPDFVLSCRAADWRYASAKMEISDDYHQVPEVWTLEGVTRDEAIEFLTAKTSHRDLADRVIHQLESMGLDGFYENPLSLELMAEVAGKDRHASFRGRADLFENACDVLRIDPNREHSELNALSKNDALDAAGAAMAALLVTGKEAITTNSSNILRQSLLNAADVAELPNATNVQFVLKSRLFRMVDNEAKNFAPYHRTIAEFLAARWLHQSLSTDRVASARFFQMISIEGAVPASLRGMFAWMAIYPQFSDYVIQSDPYGVLRYGDPGRLPTDIAIKLLSALERLEQEDPYFRAGDWENVAGGGLARPELYPTIRELISNPKTGFQLKSLVVEMLKGTEAAAQLHKELERLMMSNEEYYRIRWESAEALLTTTQDHEYWNRKVIELRRQRTVDSTRLAIEILPKIGVHAFPLPLIADCVLAESGFVAGDPSNDRHSIGSLWLLRDRISVEDIPELLSLLIEGITLYGDDDQKHTGRWENWHQIGSFSHKLALRALNAQRLDAERLLNFLDVFGDSGYSHHEDTKQIDDFLSQNTALRREIQSYILFHDTNHEPRDISYLGLRNLSFGARLQADDILNHLEELNRAELNSKRHETALRVLVEASRGDEGVPTEVRRLVGSIVQNKPHLSDVLDPPTDPGREKFRVQEEEFANRRRKRELDRQQENLEFRRELADNIDDLEAGELRWIASAAKVYLCLYSDVDSTQTPSERVSNWIGDTLTNSALRGFEATLHRTDIPSSSSIVSSYAQGKYWHYIHPIIAGLSERWRNGIGFEGVPDDVLKTGFYGFQGELIEETSGVAPLREALLQELSHRGDIVDVHKSWFEPHFEAQASRFNGLYSFVRDEANTDFAPRLSMEWLERFDDMDTDNQRELVFCVLGENHEPSSTLLQRLTKVALDKISTMPETSSLFWASALFHTDFEKFLSEVGDELAARKDLIWEIRRMEGGNRYDDRTAPPLSFKQLSWVVSHFRARWPLVSRPSGVTRGDANPWNAVEFIRSCIDRLSAIVDEGADTALVELIRQQPDGYTDALKAAQATQRRLRIEAHFEPPSLEQLFAAVKNAPPLTTADLQSVFLAALEAFQTVVHGDAANTREFFYTDEGKPRTENECRDRLIGLMKLPSGVVSLPEDQMPQNTRADLGIRYKDLVVPVEAKGQWNRGLWTSIHDQLDTLYTIDHRARGRGVYLVFWFGSEAPRGKALKRPPSGAERPKTAVELRDMLTDKIAPGRRDEVKVFVLDLGPRDGH